MLKQWLVIVAVLGAFILGAAVHKAGTSPSTPQPPLIVASLNMRGITQGIPSTTLFRPAVTGIYRASFYLAMTTPATDGNPWILDLNWTDDAGNESNELAYLPDNFAPPIDYELNQTGNQEGASPFVFEAVAGQPITFALMREGPSSGTCGLAMTVERLQ
jgi:hypothetical protein